MRFGMRVGGWVALVWLVPGGAMTATAATSATMSDRELIDQASASVKTMEGTLDSINKKVTDADGRKDIPLRNCLAKEAGDVGPLIDLARAAVEDMTAAMKSSDRSALEHEADKVSIAARKVADHKTAADGCVGLEAFAEAGKGTVVATDSNRDSSNLDPTKQSATQSAGTSSNRAPAASPF